MSATDNGKRLLLFQGGIVVLLLMTIGIFGYLTNENAKSSEENKQTSSRIEKKQDDFIERWDNRIKTSNIVNNETQKKIVQGVEQIISIVTQEFSNLTQHRIITNLTFDDLKEQQNLTKRLISEFNETNEAERGKAVDRIVDRIVERIDGLAVALNVTIEDPIAETQFNKTNIEELLRQYLANNTS